MYLCTLINNRMRVKRRKPEQSKENWKEKNPVKRRDFLLLVTGFSDSKQFQLLAGGIHFLRFFAAKNLYFPELLVGHTEDSDLTVGGEE